MSQLTKYRPPPQDKPNGMSDEAWQDHLEETRAFNKRAWRHSGGRLVESPSQDSPPKSK